MNSVIFCCINSSKLVSNLKLEFWNVADKLGTNLNWLICFNLTI